MYVSVYIHMHVHTIYAVYMADIKFAKLEHKIIQIGRLLFWPTG